MSSKKKKSEPAGHTSTIATASSGDIRAASRKIKNSVYEKELARLQIELVKLQEWIKHERLRVVVLFEGRDAAGKGGAIKRITQSLESAHLPRRCLAAAHRSGKDMLVFPTLRRPLAGGRGIGPVRPQLVQPRWSGACDGFLQRLRIPGLSAGLPGV